MLKRLLVSASLLVVLSTAALAQESKPPAPAREPHLMALDWMTHGVWHVEFKTPEGKPFTIDSTIRWAETNTAIYFETRFNGKLHYYGIYVWDPGSSKLRFFYTAENGAFTEGEAVADGDVLRQKFTISSAKGVEAFHSTVARNGEDKYDFKVFSEGAEKPGLELTYVRQ